MRRYEMFYLWLIAYCVCGVLFVFVGSRCLGSKSVLGLYTHYLVNVLFWDYLSR